MSRCISKCANKDNKENLISEILPKINEYKRILGITTNLENEKELFKAELTALVKASIEGNNNKLYGGHNDGK